MFSKKERLPVSGFLRRSKSVVTSYFALRYAKNTLSHNRYGIIVSNKVSTKAHVRALLKRRVRSVLRTTPPHSLDLLFIASPRSASLSFPALTQSLKDAVDRVTKNL